MFVIAMSSPVPQAARAAQKTSWLREGAAVDCPDAARVVELSLADSSASSDTPPGVQAMRQTSPASPSAKPPYAHDQPTPWNRTAISGSTTVGYARSASSEPALDTA